MNSQKSPAVNIRERDCFIWSFRPFDPRIGHHSPPHPTKHQWLIVVFPHHVTEWIVVEWSHCLPFAVATTNLSSLLSMAFSDGNAHQRDSRCCLPHIWCSRYSSAGWETDGGPKTASVGAVWAMHGCETLEGLMIALVNVTFTAVMWTRYVSEIVEDEIPEAMEAAVVLC